MDGPRRGFTLPFISRWNSISKNIGRVLTPGSSPTIQRAFKGKTGLESPTSDSPSFVIASDVINSSLSRGSSVNNSPRILRRSENCLSSASSSSSIATLGRGPGASLPSPMDMASNMTFSDWQQSTNASLMTTAENLIDNLEDVADLLMEIDDKYIAESNDAEIDDARASVIQRFHAGVESARGVVGVLKREKWRLNKREMSVELRMGELEDYKSHLKNDMTSLNQTVEALSLHVVQLKNDLAEAQELQEALEAQVSEEKRLAWQATHRCTELKKKNDDMITELRVLKSHTMDTLTCENKALKNEITVLRDENRKLKELVRSAETHPQENEDDHLARLTRDFLKELSCLDGERTQQENARVTPPSSLDGEKTPENLRLTPPGSPSNDNDKQNGT